jgi:TonB family protein
MAVVVIAVVWGGIRLFGTDPAPQDAIDSVARSGPEVPAGGESAPASAPPADAGKSSAAAKGLVPAKELVPAKTLTPAKALTPANARAHAKSPALGRGASALASRPATATEASSAGVHEVIPDVPQRARRTIRGTVRVSIRVIVEQDGTVFAALAEQRGPSRYFERLAIEAAKQWTFPPADTSDQRLMLVKFGFTRDGTTAQAVPVM